MIQESRAKGDIQRVRALTALLSEVTRETDINLIMLNPPLD